MPAEVIQALEAAVDKKALEPVVLDLRGLSDVADFFLLCAGTSDRQVQAIAEGIEERLSVQFKRRPSHVEGRRHGDWILLDYIDFVVHVFREETRRFYRLERLWGDAPALDPRTLTPSLAAARPVRRSRTV